MPWQYAGSLRGTTGRSAPRVRRQGDAHLNALKSAKIYLRNSGISSVSEDVGRVLDEHGSFVAVVVVAVLPYRVVCPNSMGIRSRRQTT